MENPVTVQISSEIVFSGKAVLLEVSELNANKSLGPGNLSAHVVFEVRHQIAKQPSAIFQLSWDTAEIPREKSEYISHLQKGIRM